MDTIAGYQKTGRVTIGPGADLVELSSDNGFRHTAVAFHPPYRAHPAIGPGLEVVKGFLEAPYVTGLLELVAHDPKQGAFVYPTGQAWSAYEVVRTLSDLGQNAGIRAGLELMYTAGEILLNAAEAGEPAGVYSHGGLTPWRVMVKADGQVEIMGYALPQVEILQFQANNNEIPGEDSFRYCPPERMVSTKEDVSADLFALSLVAFELMTGKPVYDGLVNDIRTQASRGEGTRRLFRFKDQLPNGVRDLLNLCLKPSPRDRFPDGASYLRAVQKVLSSAEASGPSLMDTMSRVSKTQRRTGESLDAGKTQSLSKADLARILAEQDNEPEPPRPSRPVPAKGAAWTPPAKGKAAEPAPSPKATPVAEVKAAPRAEPPRAAPPPQPSDSRWGRPAEGRRARAPRTTRPGEVGDEEEELDGPAPMGGSPPAAAPADAPRSRISADELIRSISSSTDGGLRRALNRSQSSASSVIDAILSDATPKRAEAAGPEALPSTPEGGLGVRRAPPRARAPLPSFDDPPPEVRRPEPSRPEPAPPPPRVVEPAPPPRAPDPVTLPPVMTTPKPPPFAPEPPKPVEAPKPVEPPKAVEPPKPVEAPRPVAYDAAEVTAPRIESGPAPLSLTGGSASIDLQNIRPPDALKATAGGPSLSYRVLRGPNGSAIKSRLPGGFTLSEAVSYLTATFVPLRADLQGRITLHYRLGPETGPAAGETLLSTYPEGSTLVLHPVVARERWVHFEVADPEHAARFRAPISTALPACAVVDHLCAWLRLPAGAWNLCQGERIFSPHLLMDEVDFNQPLVLKR